MIAFPIVAIILLCTAYLFGAYSYPRNIWPIELLRKIKSQNQLTPSLENYDRFGRFIKFSNKTQVSCPPQTNDTAVLLAIGQSNSANHAEKRLSTQYPQQVFNYFEGKCYVASSPLLGATGEEGEFITPLADKLIADGVYKSVVIVSSGIGATPIARWQQDGDLNEMLLATLLPLQKQYKITDIVWHQGESDFLNSTSAKVYEKSFNSLLSSLKNIGVSAPTFISIATKCGNNSIWTHDNPTALGQKSLVDNKSIFLAANTDTLLEPKDRRQQDVCHFTESGQLKTAAAYAQAIAKYRKSN